MQLSRFKKQQHPPCEVRVRVCVKADLLAELGYIEGKTEEVLRARLALSNPERLGRRDDLQTHIAIVWSERTAHEDGPVVVASVGQLATRPRAEHADGHALGDFMPAKGSDQLGDSSLRSLARSRERREGPARPVGERYERAGWIV